MSCGYGKEMYKKAWSSAKLLFCRQSKPIAFLSSLLSSPSSLLKLPTDRVWSQSWTIERFHSRGQHLCKLIATKEIVYIRKEFNSHRIGLEHQYGCRDVIWSYVIGALQTQLSVGGFWSDWWVFNFGQIYNLEMKLGTSKALFTLNIRESEEKFNCYFKISFFLVLFFLKFNNVVNRLCSAQLKSPSKTWNWEQKSS